MKRVILFLAVAMLLGLFGCGRAEVRTEVPEDTTDTSSQTEYMGTIPLKKVYFYSVEDFKDFMETSDSEKLVNALDNISNGDKLKQENMLSRFKMLFEEKFFLVPAFPEELELDEIYISGSASPKFDLYNKDGIMFHLYYVMDKGFNMEEIRGYQHEAHTLSSGREVLFIPRSGAFFWEEEGYLVCIHGYWDGEPDVEYMLGIIDKISFTRVDIKQ